MDGEHISNALFQGFGTQIRLVDGRKCGDEIRELAFSLPLLTSSVTGARQKRIDAAGTITVKLLEAINVGTEYFTPFTRTKIEYLPHGEFPQLSKRDIAKKENLGAVIREGRTFLKLIQDSTQRAQIRTHYTKGRLLDEMTVHYRPLESLLDLGVISHDEYTELKAALATEMDTVLCPGSEIADSYVVPESEIKSKVVESVPVTAEEPVKNELSSVKKETASDQSTNLEDQRLVKQEGIESEMKRDKEMIKTENKSSEMMSCFSNMKLEKAQVDDDDVIYIDTSYNIKKQDDDDDLVCLGDDSVVYLGDDSCYVFDVTPQEISMVDLTDDVTS